MTSPEPVHTRTLTASARRTGPAELEITGRLLDERPSVSSAPSQAVGSGAAQAVHPQWFGPSTSPIVHDMTLTLRVRYPDLVITHAEGGMAAHPYTLCGDALPPLQGLVGLSVARGFTRAVNACFGRQLGCAHMTALVHAMAPVVRQAAGAAFRQADRSPVAAREAAGLTAEDDRWFIDSCQAWRSDGPLAGRLRAGDLSGLRAYSARQSG